MTNPLRDEQELLNLAVVDRLFTDVFDTGNVDLLDVLIDESFET